MTGSKIDLCRRCNRYVGQLRNLVAEIKMGDLALMASKFLGVELTWRLLSVDLPPNATIIEPPLTLPFHWSFKLYEDSCPHGRADRPQQHGNATNR